MMPLALGRMKQWHSSAYSERHMERWRLRLPLIGRQVSLKTIVIELYSTDNRASVAVVFPQDGGTNDSASPCGANLAPRDPWLVAIPFSEAQTLSIGQMGKHLRFSLEPASA